MKRIDELLCLSVLVLGAGQLATACGGDSDDDSGTGGAKAGSAGSSRGGSSQGGSANGGRAGRWNRNGGTGNTGMGGTGNTGMGGTVFVDRCTELSAPPENGQSCSSIPNGTYCDGVSGPCICTDGRWECHDDGQAHGGSTNGGSSGSGQSGSSNPGGRGGTGGGASGEPGLGGDSGAPATGGTNGASGEGNAGEPAQSGAAGA